MTIPEAVDDLSAMATDELLEAAEQLRKSVPQKRPQWPQVAGWVAVALALLRVGVVLGNFETSMDGFERTQSALVKSVDGFKTEMRSRVRELELSVAHLRGVQAAAPGSGDDE